jgi:hypothetical protein
MRSILCLSSDVTCIDRNLTLSRASLWVGEKLVEMLT